jgi:hypothetical protein
MSRVRHFLYFEEEVSGDVTGWKFKGSDRPLDVTGSPPTLQNTRATSVLLATLPALQKYFLSVFVGLP